MDSALRQNSVSFGPFELDFRTHELRKCGIKIKLREKSFEVLALLLERPSELVTRDDLRARLWPKDVFVDFENNLNAAVARLRQALCDSAENPQYIETLPRHGYRFIATIGKQAARRQNRDHVRVAVLPFENLSGDPDQEYFSDGLTEELITELASMSPQLGVIARASAMRYKRALKPPLEIGEELDVDYIVEGSVRRTTDRVRISAQLIIVKDQIHLWANSYDRDLSDVLGLQREVARAIAGQIDVKLSNLVVRPSVSSEVHDLYLLGLHHFNRASPEGFGRADQYFSEVTKISPVFAPAFAKQAMTHALSAFFGYVPHHVAFPKAESAARSALAMDQSLTEAHSALALVHWFHHWNLSACERELEHALALNPHDSVAHWTSAMFMGSMKADDVRASIEAELALSFDPLSLAIRSMTCWLPYWARKYDRAIAQAREVIDIDKDAIQAFYVLGTAARAKGDFDTSIAALQQAVDRFGDPFSIAYLGMSYASSERVDQAKKMLGELQRMDRSHAVSPIFFAFIYAGLGDTSKAIEFIESALSLHDSMVLWLRVSPDWDGLRSEPRFQQLVQRVTQVYRN